MLDLTTDEIIHYWNLPTDTLDGEDVELIDADVTMSFYDDSMLSFSLPTTLLLLEVGLRDINENWRGNTLENTVVLGTLSGVIDVLYKGVPLHEEYAFAAIGRGLTVLITKALESYR